MDKRGRGRPSENKIWYIKICITYSQRAHTDTHTHAHMSIDASGRSQIEMRMNWRPVHCYSRECTVYSVHTHEKAETSQFQFEFSVENDTNTADTVE